MCGLFTKSTGASKMAQVKDYSIDFVDTVHRNGTHFGTISHFNTTYSIGTPRTKADDIISDIKSLSPSGRTALYDSIIKSMHTIQKSRVNQNRTGIPALLLTFTDGIENESHADLDEVRTAIKELGFHPKNRCYFAIAGIGDASQQELRDICDGGLGLYTHADDDIQAAFKLFLIATLAVVYGRESYAEIREHDKGKSLKAIIREFEGITIGPVEYMLNIDASSSMSKTP